MDTKAKAFWNGFIRGYAGTMLTAWAFALATVNILLIGLITLTLVATLVISFGAGALAGRLGRVHERLLAKDGGEWPGQK